MTAGIGLGLGAAAAQSLSYVLSRLYVMRRARGVARLLIQGHVFMGLMSLALLPLLPLRRLPPPGQFVLPLAGSAAFYLLGQAAMFRVLRRQEASRISPLLGLKIAILAGISVLAMKGHLNGWQWVAVAMSVAAALALRTSGRRLPWRAVGGILLACMAYSLSDLSIFSLVTAMRRQTGYRDAVLTSVVLTYIICGLAGLVAWPLTGAGGRRQKGDWQFALPWAACWLGAMMLLFSCFASVGVVFGNILQSTRGLISIVMGWVIALLGHVHLEGRTSRSVLFGRLAAAALMTAAIALYSSQMTR